MGWTLDSAYTDPLALVIDAAKQNAGMPNWLKRHQILPSSVKTDIDFNRWNKVYPYALIMAEMLPGPGIYIQQAAFVLPIPPEQLSIQTPYAIQVSKTLGGTVEEHNADPLRLIAFTGTTGVMPTRASSSGTPTKIFGGVVSSVQQTANVASSFFSGGSDTVFDVDTTKGSGYSQFHLLEMFLTSYVRIKKEGKPNLRLIFASFKDKKAYIVTPLVFNMRREAGKALKYRYDLQLKAWKTISTDQIASMGVVSFKDLNVFDKALGSYKKKLSQARGIITNARNVVRNARNAVNEVLDTMRETSLFLSEGIGLAQSVIDLPYQIIADSKQAFISSWGEDAAFRQDFEELKSSYKQAIYDLNDLANGHTVNRRPSTIDQYFENPTTPEAQEFLGRADMGKMSIPKALADRIEVERKRVRDYTNEDFARMRDRLQRNIVEISDALGASNTDYDRTYNNVHATVTRDLGQDDWDILFALNDTLSVLNGLAQQDTAYPTPMEYLVGFAAKSNVPFNNSVSKFAIPMPYDTTLEQLAFQYLGDPDRWIEIAQLNGLREPYIDEVGFTRNLLVNGRNTDVAVTSKENLVIGQAVWIQSAAVKREKRHIQNIKVQAPNYVVLTLDGSPDLSRYTTADNAFIQAFKPDTVNSHQLIWIPSNDPSLDVSDLSQIPGINVNDDLLEVGGIDLMLKADNDLAITPDGDCKFAYGMGAFVQHARVALGTPRGALVRHPEFGLPIQAGMSVADLDLQTLKAAVADIFTSDPTFNGVTKVSIQQAGGAVNIGLNVAVSGQNHPIPVSFQVQR